MKKVFLLTIALTSSLISSAYSSHNPKNLLMGEDVKQLTMVNSDGDQIDPGMICSMTLKGDNYLMFCNYSNLFIMDIGTGETTLIPKPKDVDRWVPTGLKYSEYRQELYVANYLGNDILVFNLIDKNDITLLRRYTDAQLKGPENIDILDNGDFATADFDGSKIIFFNTNGQVWSRHIPTAHGISFSHDKKSVLVSSLGDKKIYKFDLSGNLLGATGELQWGENGYMWPTSLASCPEGVFVSDAHTGKITLLKDDLSPVKTLGGNGPGMDLFNMPYGVVYVNDDFIFVCDTFKSRILKINSKENKITCIYQGAHPKPDSNLPFEKVSVYNHIPLGLEYKQYINLSEKTKIEFNGLKFNSLFNSGYCALVSDDKTLSLDKCIGIFTGSIHYFVSAKHFKCDGLDFTIIGSPQVSRWFVMHKGITCTIDTGLDFWLHEDYLMSSSGVAIRLTEIASLGLSKIKSYVQAVQDGKPILEAMTQSLGIMDFRHNHTAFHGTKGSNFLKKITTTENAEEQRKAAECFLKSVEKDKMLYFVDIAIASMIACDFKAF